MTAVEYGKYGRRCTTGLRSGISIGNCFHADWHSLRSEEASIYATWRQTRYLSRLADPIFIPLGEPSIYPAWRQT